MISNKNCIYRLYATNNDYFYIGSTKRDIQDRFREHLYESFRCRRDFPVARWMRFSGIENIKCELLDSIDLYQGYTLANLESEYIFQHIESKYNLNIICGLLQRVTINPKSPIEIFNTKFTIRKCYRENNRQPEDCNFNGFRKKYAKCKKCKHRYPIDWLEEHEQKCIVYND